MIWNPMSSNYHTNWGCNRITVHAEKSDAISRKNKSFRWSEINKNAAIITGTTIGPPPIGERSDSFAARGDGIYVKRIGPYSRLRNEGVSWARWAQSDGAATVAPVKR